MNPFKSLFSKKKQDPPLHHLEEIYISHLGDVSSVFHETQDRGNHVDVYRFNERDGREFITYLTGGMSRRPQPGADDLEHVELVFYAEKHNDVIPNALRNFSHYPWETGSAFLGWDLIPLGQYSKEVFGSDRFGGILVCPSTRRDDHNLAMAMRSSSPIVSPLNIMPLLVDEFDYATETGIKEFLDRVSASQFSVTFSPSRESVLSDT